MSPLTYRCIRCGSEWGDETSSEDNISHGYCRACLRDMQKELVRKKQIREGYSPCYARGYEDCTEERCAFWSSCTERAIKDWEEQVQKRAGATGK